MAEQSDPVSFGQGRYEVVRMLGSGGQAETFEAVDKQTQRRVAVKRFRVKGAKSWKDVELAEREAKTLATLDHPAIPKFVANFEEDGILYLVTELIEGHPLQSGTTGLTQRLAESDVLQFLTEITDILRYLHTRNPPVIHRDIKPGNVIRKPDGHFALVDFGAVRDGLRPDKGSTIVGTFGYMAPEQFQGRALPVSDVYSTAATAMYLLTGQQPETLPHKGLAIDVKAALNHSGVSNALADTLQKMLEPDPDTRAANANAAIGVIQSLRNPGEKPVEKLQDQPAPLRVNVSAAPSANPQKNTGGSDPLTVMNKIGHSMTDQLPLRVAEVAREEQWQRRGIAASEKVDQGLDTESERLRKQVKTLPWFARVIMGIFLTLLLLWITIFIRTLAPVFLRVLSLIFGASLRRAAHVVEAFGKQAVIGVGRMHDVVTDPDKQASQNVRVETRDEVRVNVSEPRESVSSAELGDKPVSGQAPLRHQNRA